MKPAEIIDAADRAIAALPFDIERTPSAVPGSPWERLEVYLTDEKAEGPHVVVTAVAEFAPAWEAYGYDVGAYTHYEDDAAEMVTCGLDRLAINVQALAAALRELS